MSSKRKGGERQKWNMKWRAKTTDPCMELTWH